MDRPSRMTARTLTIGRYRRGSSPSVASAEHWLGGSAAALASLVIHAVLIGSAISGPLGHKPQRYKQPGVGTTATTSDTEPTMTLIFIEEAGIGSKLSELQENAAGSNAATAVNPYLSVASPIPTVDSAEAPLDEKDRSDEADSAASDQRGHAKLFGLYMGQIQARIERAWLRPRSAIGATTFDCQVQVTQSKEGRVLEVTLRKCNGDSRWQLSLVRAIEQASPLPSPPDPAVFSDALRLSFRSDSYDSDGNDAGFEPPFHFRATASSDLSAVTTDASATDHLATLQNSASYHDEQNH